MKVLGIADSDSYVKWGAGVLDRMPADWDRTLAVLRTPALPSSSQLESALSGTKFTSDAPTVVDLAELAARIASERPDLVLLSVRGPVVRVLVRMIVASMSPRPVIISGLPGISIPETLNALYYRSQVDFFLLHSKREISAFTALASELGIDQDFGLATLPFLPVRRANTSTGDDIVFAAQAKVPRRLVDRQALVSWLVDTARLHPERRVVVKLRGLAGEPQTHSEKFPYDVLLASMPDVPPNVIVSTGPMASHLETASALVTVSSTAAIEAVAVGVPVLAIDDFGVTAKLINVVFEHSGLLANSDSLKAAEFRLPDEHWLDENYFHSPFDETWMDGLTAILARHATGELPLRPQFRGSIGGGLRHIWDRKIALGPYDRSPESYVALAVGLPLRGLVRRVRAVQARLKRSREAAAEKQLADTRS